MGDTGPGAGQEAGRNRGQETETSSVMSTGAVDGDPPTGEEEGGIEGGPLGDQSDQSAHEASADDAGEAPEERPPAGAPRTRIVVAVLLLVIAATGGVLLGMYASSPDRRPRPVTTLAPSPPTTAPTSTATVPASPTTP